MRFFRIRYPCCRKRSCSRRCTRSTIMLPKASFCTTIPGYWLQGGRWGRVWSKMAIKKEGSSFSSSTRFLWVPTLFRRILFPASQISSAIWATLSLSASFTRIIATSSPLSLFTRQRSSQRKSNRAQTTENELPLELFILLEDLAARFLWGETIELERSAEP